MAKEIREVKSKPLNLDDDIKPRALHYIYKTIQKYGSGSFFWQGPKPTLIITDAALIKEVTTTLNTYHKQVVLNPLTRLFAPGIVSLEDDKWVKHRQIVNPAFHQDKLKLMVPAFIESCHDVMNQWEKLTSPQGSVEMDAWPHLKAVTCDAISRTAFGSNYIEGRKNIHTSARIVRACCEVFTVDLYSGTEVLSMGCNQRGTQKKKKKKFLPTKSNSRMREIENEIRPMIRSLIVRRIESSKAGKPIGDDLLGIMVESNLEEIKQGGHKSYGINMEEIIDECKVFYFAGQDTTSTLLASTMFLLSRHPDWQIKTREEVLSVFGKQKPDHDRLNNLKIVTMILQEVLRLYPPIVAIDRQTVEETKLGDLTLPAGVGILVPIIYIHHSREVWGDDAMEFNPQRFSEGMAKATKGDGMFFPFGWGPRICVGQNFAFIEAKVMLAMILQRFSFELSPSYTHAPHTILTLQPQHGLNLIVRKV